MPSSATGPMLLLLARDCLLLLVMLPAPPTLPVFLGLCLLSAAKAANELALGPPCSGEALRLRWWPGVLAFGRGPVLPAAAGATGLKPGPVPSGYTWLR